MMASADLLGSAIHRLAQQFVMLVGMGAVANFPDERGVIGRYEVPDMDPD
jgi:hypothetical protein